MVGLPAWALVLVLAAAAPWAVRALERLLVARARRRTAALLSRAMAPPSHADRDP